MLKFKAGDKFLLKASSIDHRYSKGMQDIFKNEKVFVEIDSYEINSYGHIGYRLAFKSPELAWRWYVSENQLENDFISIGKDNQSARFILMDY